LDDLKSFLSVKALAFFWLYFRFTPQM
jgi:hypothetical protein